MHTFKILKPPEASRKFVDFGFLNRDLSSYISEEPNLLELGRCFGGINKQYLSLHHLSLNPFAALRRLGCDDAVELHEVSSYTCGFLGDGLTRNSLVPLGVVVNDGIRGLRRYGEAFDKYAKYGRTSEYLHLLPDGERFTQEVLTGSDLFVPCSEVDTEDLCYSINRFEQLFVGSGCTRKMLADGEPFSVLRPVGLALDNGDTLLAYAYRQAIA